MLDSLQRTSPGPDNLPFWFLWVLAPFLAKPLSQMYNLSITKSLILEQWKYSTITHVAKVANPAMRADYRPISVTPIMWRLLEQVIVKEYRYRTLIHPDCTHLFQDQFAFRPTGSTTAALVSLILKFQVCRLNIHTYTSLLLIFRKPSPSSFTFQNTPISSSNLVKDLGVLVDPDLKFASHIHDFVSRAKLRSALIFRSFLTNNIDNLKRAFVTYVRPLLEYASPVWSPSLIHLINEIENVQRSFTKRLPGFSSLSYSERLCKLKLPTLELRRLIADLVICYNMVHGFSCMNIDSFFTLSKNTSLRGHVFRLQIPLSKLNVRKCFLPTG